MALRFINSGSNPSKNIAANVAAGNASSAKAVVKKALGQDNSVGALSALKLTGGLQLATQAGTASELLKGAFAYYGNFYNDQANFVTHGVARPGVAYHKDNTIVPWGSMGKVLTGMVFAKMIEDGYLLPTDRVGQYIPSFNGTGKYIKSATIQKNPDGSFKNGRVLSNWDVELGDFNFSDITINSLLSFQVGLAYDFLMHGLNAEILWGMFDPSTGPAAHTGSNAGEGPYLYHLLKFHDQCIKGYPSNPVKTFLADVTLGYSKNQATPITPINTSIDNIMAAVKTGAIPLIFAPGNPNGIPTNLKLQESFYGPAYEILGGVMDRALRNPSLTGRQVQVAPGVFMLATYAGGFADYTRARILTPLGMTNTRIIVQEQPLANEATRMPMEVIRRDGPMLFSGPNPLDPTNASGLDVMNLGVSQALQYKEIASLQPTTAGAVLKALVDVGAVQSSANVAALSNAANAHGLWLQSNLATAAASYPEEIHATLGYSNVADKLTSLSTALAATSTQTTNLTNNVANWITPIYVSVLPAQGQSFMAALTAAQSPSAGAAEMAALNSAVLAYLLLRTTDANFVPVAMKLAAGQDASAEIGTWYSGLSGAESSHSTVTNFMAAINAFGAAMAGGNAAAIATASANVQNAMLARLLYTCSEASYVTVVNTLNQFAVGAATATAVSNAVSAWLQAVYFVSLPADVRTFMTALGSFSANPLSVANQTALSGAVVGYLSGRTTDASFLPVVGALTASPQNPAAVASTVATWAQGKYVAVLPATGQAFMAALASQDSNAIMAAISDYVNANPSDSAFQSGVIPAVQSGNQAQISAAVATWLQASYFTSLSAAKQAFLTAVSAATPNATAIGFAMMSVLAETVSPIAFAAVTASYIALMQAFLAASTAQTNLSGAVIPWVMPKIARYTGKLYWETSGEGTFSDDGLIAGLKHMQLTYYNPTDYPAGGNSFNSSITDFVKLIKLYVNDGISDAGTRILNSHTIKYIFTPKVSAMVNTTSFTPSMGTLDFSGSSMCVGFLKFNDDIQAARRFANTEGGYYMSSIGNTWIYFNKDTGYFTCFGGYAWRLSNLGAGYLSFDHLDQLIAAML